MIAFIRWLLCSLWTGNLSGCMHDWQLVESTDEDAIRHQVVKDLGYPVFSRAYSLSPRRYYTYVCLRCRKVIDPTTDAYKKISHEILTEVDRTERAQKILNYHREMLKAYPNEL